MLQVRSCRSHDPILYWNGRGKPKGPPRGVVIQEPTTQTHAQTRSYATTSKEAGTSGTVVTGMLSILGHFALTLFDSVSTHSFVSFAFVSQAGFVVEHLMHVLSVGTLAEVDLPLLPVCSGYDGF